MFQNARIKRELPLYIMLIPGIIVTLIFAYLPMGGIVMAFQKYVPSFGILKSKWVGLDNFKYILNLPDVSQIIFNTVNIASMKIIFGTILAITMALLLNEVTSVFFKRTIQTVLYMPYFISWVILGGVLRDIFSLDGIVNQLVKSIGFQPIIWLGDNHIFPYLTVVTDAWQSVGFALIVYMAAIVNINPSLYEAAIVDGASRWKQVLHVTLPGMKPTIVLMITLSLGKILNAGFDQIFVLYSPIVYQSGDIIDTWVYRAGLIDAQYSIATAVGLFKSTVSCFLISVSYYLAYKFADYRIF